MLNNVLNNLSLKFQKLASNNDIRDISLISLIYTFCHGLSLFNTGIFWDDWLVALFNKTEIFFQFIQAGGPWQAYYLNLIFSLPYGITIARFVVFLSFLIATLALYGTLKSFKSINRDTIVILCILFAIIPVNFARIAIICNLYAICYGLFFLAWYVLTKYLETGKLYFQIFALLLFFVSFITNTLLFFFLIPVVYIGYWFREDIHSIKSLIRVYARYIDFLILPLVFFGLKNIFWKPFGLYEGYTQLSLGKFLSIPTNFAVSLHSNGMYVLSKFYRFIFSPPESHILEYVFFCVFFVIIFYFIRKRNILTADSVKNDLFLIFAGFCLILVGVFPYLAVSNMPNYPSWETRNQLLLPLGISIVLFYMISLFSKKVSLSKRTVQIIFSLLIAGFIIINAGSYLDYQRDSFKQESLLMQFNDSGIMRNYSTFLFNDTTTKLDGGERTYRFHEYTSMMKYVFKNDTRFGVRLQEFQISAKNNVSYYKVYRSYNYKNYSFDNQQHYIIAIGQGDTSIDRTSTLSLMYEQYIMPKKFLIDIKNITSLSYEIYSPESGNMG